MEDYQKLLESIKQKIVELNKLYHEEKQENNELKEEINCLKKEKAEIKQQFEALLRKHKATAVSKGLSRSEPGRVEALEEVNALIREIDDCIAFLNR